MKIYLVHIYFFNQAELAFTAKSNTYVIYCGSHYLENKIDADLILPVRHYFEATGVIIIFKENIKYSYKAIDNFKLYV